MVWFVRSIAAAVYRTTETHLLSSVHLGCMHVSLASDLVSLDRSKVFYHSTGEASDIARFATHRRRGSACTIAVYRQTHLNHGISVNLYYE